MTGKILGTGSYVPGRTVENNDLARLVAVSYTHLDVYKRQL